jgi:hypothetical protein
MTRRLFGLVSTVLLLAALGISIGTASAAPPSIVNGSFESGTLEGWTTSTLNHGEGWFAYSGEEGGRLAPPSGQYAAGTEIGSGSPDTSFLSQEVSLPANTTDQLSIDLYYRSEGPISVPSPNTLFAASGLQNQQVRVDVIKPNAPIESLSPNDVLATVYASKAGDLEKREPMVLTADLSAFAGQTVRLRVAVAATEAMFVGVDDVSIASTPIPQPAPQPAPSPSNAFVKGKLTLNKKTGTGSLTVSLPDAGILTATDARRQIAVASFAKSNGKKMPILIKTATMTAAGAGTVKVPIKATPAGKRILETSGKLKFSLRLSFAPTGGTSTTQPFAAKLLKTLKPAPR